MVVRSSLPVPVTKNFNGILKKNCDWKNQGEMFNISLFARLVSLPVEVYHNVTYTAKLVYSGFYGTIERTLLYP